jgi:hypothetical protein
MAAVTTRDVCYQLLSTSRQASPSPRARWQRFDPRQEGCQGIGVKCKSTPAASHRFESSRSASGEAVQNQVIRDRKGRDEHFWNLRREFAGVREGCVPAMGNVCVCKVPINLLKGEEGHVVTVRGRKGSRRFNFYRARPITIAGLQVQVSTRGHDRNGRRHGGIEPSFTAADYVRVVWRGSMPSKDV